MRSFFRAASAGPDGVPAAAATGASGGSVRPAPLVLAAALVAVQGVIGVGIGIAFMVAGLVGGPADVADAELIGGMTVLMGAALVACGRGLLRFRSVARAPALVWQLIMLGVGFGEVRDNPALAVPLILVGGLTAAALLHPAAGGALDR